MEWIKTPESSNIAQFCYTHGDLILTVEFNVGGTYQYFDIPPVVFDALKVAPSKGQFLAQTIKGKYRFSRI
jgi:hypothetical protein